MPTPTTIRIRYWKELMNNPSNDRKRKMAKSVGVDVDAYKLFAKNMDFSLFSGPIQFRVTPKTYSLCECVLMQRIVLFG